MKICLISLVLFASLNVSLAEKKPNLDDPETRKKIIAEAIPVGLIDSGIEKLERRGKEGEELLHAPDQQAPYSGWVKGVYDIGRISGLYQYKDGKQVR